MMYEVYFELIIHPLNLIKVCLILILYKIAKIMKFQTCTNIIKKNCCMFQFSYNLKYRKLKNKNKFLRILQNCIYKTEIKHLNCNKRRNCITRVRVGLVRLYFKTFFLYIFYSFSLYTTHIKLLS